MVNVFINFLDVPSTYLYHVATTIVNGKYMSITKHTYLGTVLFKGPMFVYIYFFLFQTFHPYFRKCTCTGVMNRLSLGFSHLSLQSYLYTTPAINLMFCFLFSLPLPPSLLCEEKLNIFQGHALGRGQVKLTDFSRCEQRLVSIDTLRLRWGQGLGKNKRRIWCRCELRAGKFTLRP